jgi:hypothetical protein
VLLGYQDGKVPPLTMWDMTFQHLPFLEAIEIMSESLIGLDLFHGYNYGRSVAEFAVLAIPCICSETIEAGRRCFPNLTTNPFDLKRIHELGMKLCTDSAFYEDTFKEAYQAAQYYAQKSCYERMSTALEESKNAK